MSWPFKNTTTGILTEAGKRVNQTASDKRSRLIVALTEVVAITASVNHSTEAGSLERLPRLIDKKTKQKILGLLRVMP